MKKIKVAICDDEIVLLPQLAAMIKQLFINNHMDVEISTFHTSEGLLDCLYQQQPFDVYFLDIDIPEQDGIVVAEKIKGLYPNALILYVSATESRVYETFHTMPIAFVRKSNFSSDIQSAMNTLSRHLKKPEDTIIPFYDETNHLIKLRINRIIYAEAKEKYQYLVGIDENQMIRCSITDLEQALKPYRFIRVHRGYLVNFQYIYRIDANEIILDNGSKLPLSRYRKKEVQTLFLKYAHKDI